jgi:hypothetical protein
MAIQLSTAVRNARLDAIETTVGVAAILRIRDGSVPANCAAADAGTVLAELILPSDWMAAASGGSKGILGTWQDLSANNTGTAAHFRIYDSGGSTCHMQGTVGTAATDMIVTSTAFTAGASFTITSFTLTDGNS